MALAKTLMVQGTASTVGKSTLVTGLCRLFAQEGWRVAPFKAQNMSLNAAVIAGGGEISRSQATQAEAAGIEPRVEMNPILLKPEGDTRSQVIVLGKALGSCEARAYFHDRSNNFVEIVRQALTTMRQEYDLLIIEGAGSPIELNLAQYDLVNMRVAQMADAPVVLVGDIDRGGIFASLLGTLMLLKSEERARVKGLIVNKFRGDLTLWQEGERMLADYSHVPVLGTVPYLPDLRIAEEDGVALDEGTATLLQPAAQQINDPLEIVVLRLPYLSNYDEFGPLAAEPGVRLRFVASIQEFPACPDLIIVPGSKQTLRDLSWLWRQGLVQHIRHCRQAGCAVLGICGGYQMLGERVSDPAGHEASPATIEPGLDILPVETLFQDVSEKVAQPSTVYIHEDAHRGLFAQIPQQGLQGYQIHIGRTEPSQTDPAEGTWAFQGENGGHDGWLSSDGWSAGCYIHGLFENDIFRRGILTALAGHRTQPLELTSFAHFNRQAEYDRLAEHLRHHLDIAQLRALCHLDG